MRRLALLLALMAPLAAHAAGLTIFAAASLTDALTDIGHLWQAQHHPAPTLVFDSSATLARQIEHGAPADLFLSADEKWMDDAAAHRAIDPETRTDIVGNTLALIEPRATVRPALIGRSFNFATILGAAGRLAVGDPASVPAGIYAEQALKNFGLWTQVEARLAPAQNVRAALLLVAHGEAPAGIVYSTDAHASAVVGIAAVFPETSHDPIRYPAAVTRRGSADARAFLNFLVTPAARDVFRHYGFTFP